MPIYKLEFLPSAVKEWRRLDSSIRNQFSKKLHERLREPRVVSARLRELPDCYKIKLRSAGFRLIYQVKDEVLTDMVIAVGKREGAAAYKAAENRT